ncbi:hypothetical protein GDO81_009965 [Engystomops pustulosus]|uniref:Uncharacterized protein n=1 Tax=Engystomops pustulosus TaxID=76066 RepID=A0AAV7BX55_ENGPU|nr:hypothetical protein GDO81_009965 [Engystomops pustulosus]
MGLLFATEGTACIVFRKPNTVLIHHHLQYIRTMSSTFTLPKHKQADRFPLLCNHWIEITNMCDHKV